MDPSKAAAVPSPTLTTLKPGEIVGVGAASIAATATVAQCVQSSNKNKIDTICQASEGMHNGSLSVQTGVSMMESANASLAIIKDSVQRFGTAEVQIKKSEKLDILTKGIEAYKKGYINGPQLGQAMKNVGWDNDSINETLVKFTHDDQPVQPFTSGSHGQLRGGGYHSQIIKSIRLAAEWGDITSQQADAFLKCTDDYKNSSEFLYVVKKCLSEGYLTRNQAETILLQNGVSAGSIKSILSEQLEQTSTATYMPSQRSSEVPCQQVKCVIGVPPTRNNYYFRKNTQISPLNLGVFVGIGIFVSTLSGLYVYRKTKIYNLPFFTKLRQLNKSEIEKKIDSQSIDLENIKNVLSTHTDYLTEIKENQMDTSLNDH